MLQAEAYIRFTGGTGTMKKVVPKTVYQFGGGKHDAVGCLDIRVPITAEFIIIMAVDVIKLNVPFLLGLDTLEWYKMYFNNVTDELVFVNEGVSLPTTHSDGHVYYSWEWNPDILYTFPEFVRIHRHFFHASRERLYAVMRRAKNEDAVPGTLQRLQDVAAACDVCQCLAKEPGRFRAALPEGDVIFNRIVLIDLMFLNVRAVQHIVYKDTLFSAATFLRDGKSTATVWDAYMSVWVTVTGCHRDCHRLSQGLSQAVAGTVTGTVTGCHRNRHRVCHRLSQGQSQAVTETVTGTVTGCHTDCHRDCHRLSQGQSQDVTETVTGTVTGCHRDCHRNCHRLSQGPSQGLSHGLS